MRKVVILIGAPLAVELSHFNPDSHPHDHHEQHYQPGQQSSYVYGGTYFNNKELLDSTCTFAWDGPK